MAVGEKAMAWPPLVSPLDVTSGRYNSVVHLDKWHKNVCLFGSFHILIPFIVLHCEGESRQ